MTVSEKKGNPNPKNQFKKGNSYGQGRPKMSAEEKTLQKITRTRFKTSLNKYLNWTLSKLQKELEKPNLKAIDIILIKRTIQVLEEPDDKRVDWALDHLNGKVQDKSTIRLEREDVGRKFDPKKLSDEELETIINLQKKAEKN